MEQPVYWSDQIAFGITKKFDDRDVYVCASGISPSGSVHVGNFREIITTDFVVKSLQRMGEDTRFIYSWDDYDRFRKVPENVPDKWEKHIGKPLAEVPDPWECHDSYAEHFEQQLEEELADMKTDIEFIRQHRMFRNSEYAEPIRTAMQHRDKIRDILNQYREEPLDEDWYPLRIYCTECGKDLTDIQDYNGDYTVTYHCSECDDTFEINFKEQDSVKPPWRVDWPMRWAYENVAFEPGGKDHSAAGSSRDTGKEIVQAVFDQEPPVYQMYDFVSLKGLEGKMSSSSGDVVTLSDLKQVYTPEMIRFLFSETKPRKEFDIALDEEIISRYQRFDDIEHAYFHPNEVENEKKLEHWKRVYELAMVDIPDEQPARAPFDHLAFLAQTRPRDEWRDTVFDSLQKTGHIEGPLTEQQQDQIIERMKKARTWARNYAPERYIYRIRDQVPGSVRKDLTQDQREAMLMVARELQEEDFGDSQELDDRLFGLQEESELDTDTFFTTAYRCLLDRTDGPRLSNFIMGLGEERVASILETLD
ncbi:MAG: lysine--tRNA ligase [Candidatus Nanohaloarchaea archaeon]|nr:lysine--tRNA ligase [Candidatus Nanohaloarchaea archaeon]